MGERVEAREWEGRRRRERDGRKSRSERMVRKMVGRGGEWMVREMGGRGGERIVRKMGGSGGERMVREVGECG